MKWVLISIGVLVALIVTAVFGIWWLFWSILGFITLVAIGWGATHAFGLQKPKAPDNTQTRGAAQPQANTPKRRWPTWLTVVSSIVGFIVFMYFINFLIYRPSSWQEERGKWWEGHVSQIKTQMNGQDDAISAPIQDDEDGFALEPTSGDIQTTIIWVPPAPTKLELRGNANDPKPFFYRFVKKTANGKFSYGKRMEWTPGSATVVVGQDVDYVQPWSVRTPNMNENVSVVIRRACFAG